VDPAGRRPRRTPSRSGLREIARFPFAVVAYCTYHRLPTLLVGSELSDAVHTVKIEIHPQQPDQAEILAQRREKIDKPERFDDTAFYPGALLLVGELVPGTSQP
jgi:hypothetical protein